jgi:hypothetical protein
MVRSEKIPPFKKLKDAKTILEKEKLDILNDKFDAAMVDDDAAFLY